MNFWCVLGLFFAFFSWVRYCCTHIHTRRRGNFIYLRSVYIQYMKNTKRQHFYYDNCCRQRGLGIGGIKLKKPRALQLSVVWGVQQSQQQAVVVPRKYQTFAALLASRSCLRKYSSSLLYSYLLGILCTCGIFLL